MRDRDRIRFMVLLFLLVFGMVNIIFPRQLLRWGLAPRGFEGLNGRQDRIAIKGARVIGAIIILICIAGTALHILLYYC